MGCGNANAATQARYDCKDCACLRCHEQHRVTAQATFAMHLVCAQPWHELTHRSANTGNLCASSQQGSIAPPPLHTDCSLLSPPMQLVPVVS